MKKMDFFGVGPKIGIVLIPWWFLTIGLSLVFDSFTFVPEKSGGLVAGGAFLLLFGLVFYFYSVRLLLKGLNEGKLVTHGTFYLCQNPLYISFVLFFIPAVALLINSWLVLTASVVGYVLVKRYVSNEYNMLEEAFGEEYLQYKARTPEFFPFPYKKWLKAKR